MRETLICRTWVKMKRTYTRTMQRISLYKRCKPTRNTRGIRFLHRLILRNIPLRTARRTAWLTSDGIRIRRVVFVSIFHWERIPEVTTASVLERVPGWVTPRIRFFAMGALIPWGRQTYHTLHCTAYFWFYISALIHLIRLRKTNFILAFYLCILFILSMFYFSSFLSTHTF